MFDRIDAWMERRTMMQLRIMLGAAYFAAYGGWSVYLWAAMIR